MSALLLGACSRAPEPRDEPKVPEAEAWQSDAGPKSKAYLPPGALPEGRRWLHSPTLRPAAQADESYRDTTLVPVRRVVYRMTLQLPLQGSGKSKHRALALPAAELVLDVSEDRLRARFQGPIWPFDGDAEVRMRRDQAGAYAFDAQGGRPLDAQMLSRWFSREAGAHPPSLLLRGSEAREDSISGAMTCSFLAEWSGQSRAELEARCDRRDAPLLFKIGHWRGDRSAEVPLQLPRSSLRADELDPPRHLFRAAGAFRSPERKGGLVRDGGIEEDASLLLHNEHGGRILVLLDGSPLDWVESKQSRRFERLARGRHTLMALRAFGQALAPPCPLSLPNTVYLGKRCQLPSSTR